MDTQKILELIENSTSPEKMTKQDAIYFMQDLCNELNVRVEALEMEMENEKHEQ